MRVLTIDANTNTRNEAIRILGRNGYSAQAVQLKEEALSELNNAQPQEEPYSYVIVNLTMADSNDPRIGEIIAEIKQAIRATQGGAKLIGLLPKDCPSDENTDTLRMMMDSYLYEPFNEFELIKAIKLLKHAEGNQGECGNKSQLLPTEVDWNPTQVIEAMACDKAFFLEILRYFTDQLIYRVMDMERSIQTNSPKSLAVAAHAVHAGATQFQLTDLMDVSLRLETASNAASWDEIDDIFELFETTCFETVQCFSSYLATEYQPS